jgi:REP-associated tyrosine transposase
MRVPRGRLANHTRMCARAQSSLGLSTSVFRVPHTLSRHLVHWVFSTKGRIGLIHEPEALWKRLGVIAPAKDISLLTAGGTANHVHPLIALSPTMTLANAVQNLKAHSSRWMKQDVPRFAWQEGYGGFGVSELQRQTVLDYIGSQAEHHRKWSYEQEFLTLVRKSGVEFDPRYLFG